MKNKKHRKMATSVTRRFALGPLAGKVLGSNPGRTNLENEYSKFDLVWVFGDSAPR